MPQRGSNAAMAESPRVPPQRHAFEIFDPLLAPADADRMVELCERFGSYGMYSEEARYQGFGAGLPARYDAALNFVRSGGRFGRREPAAVLAARTNYFRETYAYGDRIFAPGIEPFLRHEGLVEGARRIHGRPLVEPAIVYANLLVPGQELAVHTDVPEFRGANRMEQPQWLLVAMHHSGLFHDWRMPIATAVAYFQDARGGAFAFYPDGPDAPARAIPVRKNTAVLLDTDSVFHGVDRVEDVPGDLPALRPGMRLRFVGDRSWEVGPERAPLARYGWEELRFSVSWKAYCFRDESERRAWREHSADLSLDFVLDRLVEDLKRRGRIDERPSDEALPLLLIDEYIRFPKPAHAG
jgi:hypothetical protein